MINQRLISLPYSVPLRFCLLMAIACATTLISSPGFAQAPRPAPGENRNIVIPAQALSDALHELARITGTQIAFSSEITIGKISNKVEGTYSLQDALRQLLENTQLRAEFLGKNSVIIFEDKTKPTPTTPVEPAPAIAREPDPPLELEVVMVTGSRVARSQFDHPFPSQSLTSMYIERNNHTSLSDAIHSLPIMCEPRYSLYSSNRSGNSGESFSDLFCLGSQRTLTLINGRRTVSSNEPANVNEEAGLQVDLNVIPRIMIKNIEVISVGSAPVYGSDAIAGTVNILLHDRYEGFKFDVQRGRSELGDGEQNVAAFMFGKNFRESSNLTFAYEYYEQNPIFADAREFTRRERDYVAIASDVSGINTEQIVFASDIVNPLVSLSGIPSGARVFEGNPAAPADLGTGQGVFALNDFRALTFNDVGRLSLFNRGIATSRRDQRVGGDGLREAGFLNLRGRSERHNVALAFNAEISQQFSVSFEFQGYQGRSASIEPIGNVVPRALNASFTSLPVSIAEDDPSPYLHPEDLRRLRFLIDNVPDDVNEEYLLFVSSIRNTDTVYIHKDWREVVDPEVVNDSSAYRGVLGLSGSWFLNDTEWEWDLSLSAGRTRSEIERTRINADHFTRATQDVIVNSNGDLDCGDGCTPLNPLGRSYSQAAVDYVTTQLNDQGDVEQKLVTGTVKGPISELPGGDWTLVLGAEARDEFAEYQPESYIEPRSGGENIASLNRLKNEFDTRELFLESVAPILGNDILPLLEKVEIDLNWRGVDHSTAGKDNTWSAGTRIHLARDASTLVMRGNFTRSIRSPSLLEVNRPFSFSESLIEDPCDSVNVVLGSNPETRLERCVQEAASLGAEYDASSFFSQIPEITPIRLGGTPDLKNEKADSYTLGLVYQYDGEANLKVSADLVDISISDAIIERDLNNVASLCYDEQNESACRDIIRDRDDFQLIGIANVYENIGELAFRSLQYNAQFEYALPEAFLLPSTLHIDFNAYQLLAFEESSPSGTDSRVGRLRYPKWRWQTSIGLVSQYFDIAWTTQVNDSVEIIPDFSLDGASAPEVESYWLHHLSLNLHFHEHFSARLGIRNVTDESPPLGLPSREVGATYDAIGRYYSFGLMVEF